MDSVIFNAMEIDAVGEILNISLGASATAVSTMLGKRVDITTPKVHVLSYDEFQFRELEPAVGVEITYVSGLEGNNILLLKRSDVKLIVEVLMGMEFPDETFELDEMNMSAICEVMNQMMGASATALSDFLGEVVNISTPVSFEVSGEEDFKRKYFPTNDPMVVVSFLLIIEDVTESEFMSVMSISLVKKLISGLGFEMSDMDLPPAPEAPQTPPPMEQPAMPQMQTPPPMEQPAMPQMQTPPPMEQPAMPQMQTPPPMEQPAMPQMQTPPPMMQQAPPQQYQTMPQQYQTPPQQYQTPPYMPQMAYVPPTPAPAPDPKLINVQPMMHPTFADGTPLGEEQANNLSLIMGVPLEISVEIGRTKKPVKEILEYTQGTLVVLDKLAGEQVDLYVNGQCVAKGDVVVVDDCFGVRITEILKNPESRLGLAKGLQ